MDQVGQTRRPGAYVSILKREKRPSFEIVGLDRKRFGDVYHVLLTISWRRFFLQAIALYLAINLVFGLLFWLQPGGVAGARPGSFSDAFFFSVQTLGTIGYGVLSPHSLYAHLLVTAEAFISIALTAVSTGVIFARISRPTARVLFSRIAVVTRINGAETLLLRAANVRVNQILEAEVTLSLAKQGVSAEGVHYRRFFDLKTLRSRSPLFALSWSIMHVIDEDSPLYQATSDTLEADEAEIIVVLSGVDETFAQRIHTRYSYVPADIVFGRRLADVISKTDDGGRRIDYALFHELAPLEADAL